MTVTDLPANAEALTERGYNYLSDEEFGLAADSFNRALDLDAKAFRAYWGLTLAERQGRTVDGCDLIDVGICIDRDPNFRRACQYADEENKARFSAVARNCAFQSQAKILALIADHKLRPATLRAKLYAESAYADARLVDANTVLLREDAFTELTAQTPRTLLSLLDLYGDASALAPYDKDRLVSAKICAMYTEFMNRVFGIMMDDERYVASTASDKSKAYSALETKYSYHIENRERLAALWANPRGDAADPNVGADEMPGTVGERWLYIAEKWNNNNPFNDSLMLSHMVLGFIAKAMEAGAEKGKCIAAEQQCIETAMRLIPVHDLANGNDGSWEYDKYTELINRAPDKTSASVVVIRKLIDDQRWWDELSQEYAKYKNEVLQLTETIEGKKHRFSWSDDAAINELNDKIKKCVEQFRKDYEKKEAIIKQYSETALSSEDGIDGLSVRLTEADILRLEVDFGIRRNEFEALSGDLNRLKEARFSLLRRKINRKSVGYCILSAVLFLVAAFFFYQALQCFRQPSLMREPARPIFLTVFLSLTVVIGVSLSLLSFSCARSTVFYKERDKILDSFRVWNYSHSLFAPVFLVFLLTALLFVGACVFLIWGHVIGASAALRKTVIDTQHIAVCAGAIMTALFSINSAVFAFQRKRRILKKNLFLYLMPVLYLACLAYLLFY